VSTPAVDSGALTQAPAFFMSITSGGVPIAVHDADDAWS
jgi:hypothetical protein